VHCRSIALSELGKYGWSPKRKKESESLPGAR
jgi:hypothetical protein